MKKHVFDQSVLGLSFRGIHETTFNKVLCSKVVIFENKVEAFIKTKTLDISVLEIPLNSNEIEIFEGGDEVIIRNSEYLFVIMLNIATFLDPTEKMLNFSWERCSV